MTPLPLSPEVAAGSVLPVRKRIGFDVSEDLYMWLRLQADARELPLSAYLRSTLHALKRRQDQA